MGVEGIKAGGKFQLTVSNAALIALQRKQKVSRFIPTKNNYEDLFIAIDKKLVS